MPLITDALALLEDADGDLDISAGTLQFVAGVAAFIQLANARIELIRGELFRDRTLGVPLTENDYVTADEALIGQPHDDARSRRAFTAAIADTPGYGAITSMDFAVDPTTRHLAMTWAASTAWGDTGAVTVEL